MTKYKFRFPRIDAENVVVDAEDFSEATKKAIAERDAHTRITRVEGEEYTEEKSLVNPK
jgi:hypothetical protein